jgi:hypothetical protein
VLPRPPPGLSATSAKGEGRQRPVAADRQRTLDGIGERGRRDPEPLPVLPTAERDLAGECSGSVLVATRRAVMTTESPFFAVSAKAKPPIIETFMISGVSRRQVASSSSAKKPCPTGPFGSLIASTMPTGSQAPAASIAATKPGVSGSMRRAAARASPGIASPSS